MQDLAGFSRSEHGCATQNLGSSQADRGGGTDSGFRQTDHESLAVHGCFGGPYNLIPGIPLGALIRQLENGAGRAVLTKRGNGDRRIGCVDYSDPSVGDPGLKKNVVIDGPEDQ
jgi:hypothetical protein